MGNNLSKTGFVPGTEAAMTARPVSMPVVMDTPKVYHDGSVLVHSGCRYAIRTALAIYALQNIQLSRLRLEVVDQRTRLLLRIMRPEPFCFAWIFLILAKC